jgi:5-methylcytosine-specific restriction endonuclease McrA
MIPLKPIPRPSKLTDDLVIELTERFQKTGESVWLRRYIIDGLLLISHGKCCFCECKITEESKYPEAEHFFPKVVFIEKVLEWENLLAACKRCNGCKNDHNTLLEPIIHPTRDTPKEHLKLNHYFFRHKTELGKTTVKVLRLNDVDRLVLPRQRIGNRVKDELDNLEDWMVEYVKNPDVKKRNKIISKLKGVMREGQTDSEYSATVATVIVHDESYHLIKDFLTKNGWWDDECQALENVIFDIAFDIL